MGKHLQVSGTIIAGNFAEFDTSGFAIDSGFNGTSFINSNITIPLIYSTSGSVNGNIITESRNSISGGATFSSILGGDGNDIINSNYSSILGGQNNNVNGFDDVHIIGSNITADKDNALFTSELRFSSPAGITDLISDTNSPYRKELGNLGVTFFTREYMGDVYTDINTNATTEGFRIGSVLNTNVTFSVKTNDNSIVCGENAHVVLDATSVENLEIQGGILNYSETFGFGTNKDIITVPDIDYSFNIGNAGLFSDKFFFEHKIGNTTFGASSDYFWVSREGSNILSIESLTNNILLGSNIAGAVIIPNDTTGVENLQVTEGIAKCTVQPSTLGTYDDLSYVTKEYTDNITSNISESEVVFGGSNGLIGEPAFVYNTITNTLSVPNLVVSGTNTNINTNTLTTIDPIISIGGGTNGDPLSVDDNKDRGIEFQYYNGSAKKGFFGFDDSTQRFTFIPDGTNTNEVFSGVLGDVDIKTLYTKDIIFNSNLTPTVMSDIGGNGEITLGNNSIIISNDGNGGDMSNSYLYVDNDWVQTGAGGTYVGIFNGGYEQITSEGVINTEYKHETYSGGFKTSVKSPSNIGGIVFSCFDNRVSNITLSNNFFSFPIGISTQNATSNLGTKNSLALGGNGLTIDKDNYVFVENLEIQGGIAQYTIDPTTNGSWGDRSIPDKAYVDSFTYFEQFTPGTTNVANTITHNLGSTRVLVEVWDVVTDETISVDIIKRIDVDTIEVYFSTNPTGDVEIVIKK